MEEEPKGEVPPSSPLGGLFLPLTALAPHLYPLPRGGCGDLTALLDQGRALEYSCDTSESGRFPKGSATEPEQEEKGYGFPRYA